MNPEFWLTNWQNNKIGFHQSDYNPYLTSHWHRLSLSPSSWVFVPLCGKSLDILWLRQQGYSVIGVELSEIAVQQFFDENNIQPSMIEEEGFYRHEVEGITLLQGDFFNLVPRQLQNVSAVFDRGALVALPPELRERYVDKLAELLPAGTSMLLIVFEYDQNEMPGPPFSVKDSELTDFYGEKFHLEVLHKQDVLDQYEQFRACGLSRLYEKVYLLKNK